MTITLSTHCCLTTASRLGEDHERNNLLRRSLEGGKRVSTGGCYLVMTVVVTVPGTVMPVMVTTVMTGRVVTTGHDGSVPANCADVGSGLSENKALHLSQT